MKQVFILLAASTVLYSCSPKVSRSVADSSTTGSNNTSTKTETSSPALKSGNTSDKAEAATSIK